MNYLDSSPDKLLLAIIQSQDTDNACHALGNINISPIQLPSTGAFLGIKNTTLLISSTDKIWNSIVQTLKLTCKKRIEYIPISSDVMMTPTHSSVTQVLVGGAIVFSIAIEHFEEI